MLRACLSGGLAVGMGLAAATLHCKGGGSSAQMHPWTVLLTTRNVLPAVRPATHPVPLQ